MRPSRVLLLAAILLLVPACIFGASVTGRATLNQMAGNPLAGLETLTHYRAAVTDVIHEQTGSGSLDRTAHASLAVWTADDATFETRDFFDEAGQPVQVTLGKVGPAVYLQRGMQAGCQVWWDSMTLALGPGQLAPYLYPFRSGTPAADETVNGIAAHVYQLNTDSIGIAGVQAKGKAWIAASGGYLVKYHLELSGGEELFGEDGQGTRTIDYELSEVNDGSAVAYPGDCLPVLTDIPAMQDAQEVQRLPGDLLYTSVSTADQLQAFYEQFFTGRGWENVGEYILDSGETDILYLQPGGSRSATLALQPQDGAVLVEVDVPEDRLAPASAETGATSAVTPSAGGSQNLSVVIITSLSKLIGDDQNLGALPSFKMSMDERMPAASGTDITILQADLQGVNRHYVLTSGKRTEIIHIDDADYAIENGKAQPASPLAALGWTTWQLDPVSILTAASSADPAAQAGTTLEGRSVDVYAVDSTPSGPLPDMSMGLLPFTITAIQGTIWIDHDTGSLLKADLTFEADVKKPGESTFSTHGKGEFHFAVSQIGKVTVSLPK